MAMTHLRIDIHFLSDWHVGSGAGRQGYIDRLVRRDPSDGLPFVPAKTLTGMLRDACESVATALDGDKAEPRWTALMTQLFGDEPAKRNDVHFGGPLSALLSIRPARFPQELCGWLRHEPRLAEALTFIKAGVAICPETGQAKEDHLRMEEMVRGDAVLSATAELDLAPLPTNCHTPARALLWAGARTVERIGGKRRRGAGRCELTLFEADGEGLEGPGKDRALDDDSATLLGALGDGAEWHVSRTTPPPDSSESATPAATSTSPAASGWTRVPLELTLQDPIVVPHRVTGNVVESLDFLPGTMLLGPLLRRLEQVLREPLFPLAARGDIRVMNAYLEVDGERGRPVPFSFEHDKHDEGLTTGAPTWNALIPIDAPRSDQPKEHRRGYISSTDGRHRPRLDQPPCIHVTHNTINDEQQRPIENEVGIYTYQAIAAGTKLRSELRLTSDFAARLAAADVSWTTRLSTGVRLGVAKKDDYSRATLTAGAAGGCATSKAAGGTITVWLLSDMLLQGPSLQHDPTLQALRRALAEALQVPLELAGDTPFRLRTRRLDGWQTRWGLPRPSLIGIEAGSIARFRIAGDPPDDLESRLTSLSHRGLGERCGEGYGEIAINDAVTTTSLRRLLAAGAITTIQGSGNQAPGVIERSSYARRLEREAWRSEMHRRIAGWAANHAARRHALKWEDDTPRANQLGRLRSYFMPFRGTPGEVDIIKHWLKSAIENNKWNEHAAAVLEAALAPKEPGGLSLLTDVLGQSRPLDGSAPVGPWEGFPVGTRGAAAELANELWPEALRTVVLTAIHTEMRQRERPKS